MPGVHASETARLEDAGYGLGEGLSEILMFLEPGRVGYNQPHRPWCDEVPELAEVPVIELEVLGQRRRCSIQKLISLQLESFLIQRPQRCPTFGCVLAQFVEDLPGDPGHGRVLDRCGGIVIGLAVPTLDGFRCSI